MFKIEGKQIIIHSGENTCTTKQELVNSPVFKKIFNLYLQKLQQQRAPLVEILEIDKNSEDKIDLLKRLLCKLCDVPLEDAVKILPEAKSFQENGCKKALHDLIEKFYDFWRSFNRFMVLHSENDSRVLDGRPYRSFNTTMEELTHLVRSTYRDICENITNDHPRIYRQVAAGCNIGIISALKPTKLPETYMNIVGKVPFIRQIMIEPPMIIDPPMNKRTGQFQKVDKNPITNLSIQDNEWLCYPAQVGSFVIFVYFHQRFIDLGCSLSNLFELATDEQISKKPDAIYLFGAPSEGLSNFGELPTVFFDDEPNNLLAAAIPAEDRFGYFGYLKKMILTLHNIVVMKRGLMPYHGAMVRILLKNGNRGNVLIIGDTATGKSETLEALRMIGSDSIRELNIIADDMGSLEVAKNGQVLGYGTEVGAFIRLDDLQQGYAFKQIDRSIIMSPQRVNARVVLPVTTIDEILQGHPVDYILYANNYEETNGSLPILEQISSAKEALKIFSEGTAKAKGTTTSEGINGSYFANIFGPPQYKDLHEPIAQKTFEAALKSGTWIGQLRTRLGIPGFETKGPEEAAKELLNLMENE